MNTIQQKQHKMVLFVGYALSNYVSYFKEQGFSLGLLEDINHPQGSDIYTQQVRPYLDLIIPINLKNKNSISKSLKGFYIHPDTILICNRDRYFYATARVADVLDLNYSKIMPVTVAKNLTNKFFQRNVFVKTYPEISPAYKRIRTFHGAYTFVRKYGFPVIIKPANLSQGQLVNICNNMEELIQKTSYVLDRVKAVYEANSVHRKPQVIIEQFITGKQYSVDSYVTLEGEIIHTPICRQVISHDLGFDDFQTYYSGYDSGLTADQEKLVFETVSKSILALDIKGAPTHTEVKIQPDGKCQIVEVNVRTGGYRAQLLKESYNFDHIQNAIHCYVGGEILTKNTLLKYSASPQFWADKEGRFQKANGLDQAKSLSSYVSHGLIAGKGVKVGPVAKGYQKILYFIFANENKQQLESDLLSVRELISFEID